MRTANWLGHQWWRRRPGALAWLLWPLSLVYRAAFAWQKWRAAAHRQLAPVPCVVVGNWVVGGVGKTPVLIALVQALVASGYRPGVLSRGYGRLGKGTVAVSDDSSAAEVGDEPLLIHRRCRVPVWVGPSRLQAARALCAAHPHVDVLVSDDGLQHHQLQPDAALVVFDARGAGNGLCLPAGPLRQPIAAALPPGHFVVYTQPAAQPRWPGFVVPRQLWPAVPLASWQQGHLQGSRPLASFAHEPMVALAGLGEPEGFFRALEAQGLSPQRLPMPDHAHYSSPWPWPAGTQTVITTEKDAVKLTAVLAQPDAAKVWVVPLDCEIPQHLLQALLAAMPRLPKPRTNGP